MIPALALAAYAGVLDLSDQTGAIARGTFGQPVGIDLVTQPVADMNLTDRRWTFEARYAPYVYVGDMERLLERLPTSPNLLLLQNGTLAAAWHDRFVRLSLREEGGYGQENTTYLALPVDTTPSTTVVKAPPVPPALQLLPNQLSTINLVSSRTTLASDLRISRPLSLSTDVGYYVYGGADTASMQVVPRQRGPFADAIASYVLTPREALVFRASGASSQALPAPCEILTPLVAPAANGPGATCAPDDTIANVTAGMAYTLSRTSNASFGLGAGMLHARLSPSDPYTTVAFPTGLATYQYQSGLEHRRTTLHLDASVGPTIDPRSGTSDYRAQGNLALARTDGWLTASESVGVTHSLVSLAFAPSITFLITTTTLALRVNPYTSLTAAFNYMLQQEEGFAVTSTVVASLGILVHASPMRF
jgi:hypothetical protein